MHAIFKNRTVKKELIKNNFKDNFLIIKSIAVTFRNAAAKCDILIFYVNLFKYYMCQIVKLYLENWVTLHLKIN